MPKIKVRCGRCGKRFTTSSPKQTFCPECEAKLRAQRAAAKSAGTKPAGAAPAPAPKIVGPGASILVPGLVSTTTVAPPEPGELGFGRGAHSPRDTRAGSSGSSGTRGAPAKTETHPGHPAADVRASRPGPEKGQPGQPGQRGERTQQPKQPQPPRPPREPRAPRPAPPVIELTDDLRTKIEQRYLELAQPVEFDGIRTQIAGELSVPKALVKRAVMELRARMQMPSWWDLQTYTGGNSDLDRIRRAYVPHLPVPPVGIHKTIAQELRLDTGIVYQGIKRIRAEMRLPRFNPPALHEGEAGANAAPVAVANATEA